MTPWLARLMTLAISLAAITGLPGAVAAQDSAAFAQQLFTSGVAHYDAHEYEAALGDFRGSLSLYASPNTRLYLGRTLRELGQLPEALVELERASREAADRAPTDPRYERTRDFAHAEAEALAARVGRLAISIDHLPPGAHVTVGGVEVPTAAIGTPVRVSPGEVEIVVTADGFEPLRQSTAIVAGETSALTLALVPAAEPEAAAPVPAPDVAPALAPSPPPPAPAGDRSGLVVGGAIALGVGGAGAIAAIVTGVLAIDRYDSLSAACGTSGGCPPERAGDISEGAGLAAASTGLTVGASIAGAIGVVLLVVGALPTGDEGASAFRLVPTPGGGGVACSF